MQYHRTELSWACFVSLCLVFPIFGLSSWFVPLELCLLLRQPSFSLLGLLGCSLCCLIPVLLLNFSASWVLAISHLPKQSQRLCRDNYSFHQLSIKLVSFACHSPEPHPCGDWLFPMLCLKCFSSQLCQSGSCEGGGQGTVPPVPSFQGRHELPSAAVLLLIDLGSFSETSSALVNLWGKNLRSSMLLC